MSDNVTLTSLCGFSRKFLFSVDLNLKKAILQKILGSIFLKHCLHNIIEVDNNFAWAFSCIFFTQLNFNKTYMKCSQILKLLLATVAKLS